MCTSICRKRDSSIETPIKLFIVYNDDNSMNPIDDMEVFLNKELAMKYFTKLVTEVFQKFKIIKDGNSRTMSECIKCGRFCDVV